MFVSIPITPEKIENIKFQGVLQGTIDVKWVKDVNHLHFISVQNKKIVI